MCHTTVIHFFMCHLCIPHYEGGSLMQPQYVSSKTGKHSVQRIIQSPMDKLRSLGG